MDTSKEGDAPASDNAAEPKEVPKDGDATAPSTDKDGKATGKKSEARHAESRYADVPMNRMFCHVCNKHMWDGFVSKKFVSQRIKVTFVIDEPIITVFRKSSSRTCPSTDDG